jgi:hypothetical protein
MSAAKEFEEYARECVRLAIQQDNKESPTATRHGRALTWGGVDASRRASHR